MKDKFIYKSGCVHLKTCSEVDRMIDFVSIFYDYIKDIHIVTDIFNNRFCIPDRNILFIYYNKEVKK